MNLHVHLETRRKWLTTAFCCYAVSTLISMAVMSIGAGVLFLAILIYYGGPLAWLSKINQLLSERFWLRTYFRVSLGLAAACLLSLVSGRLYPLSYGGHFSEISILKDSLKLWYLFWPLLLLPALAELKNEQSSKVLYSWFGAFALLSCVGIIQYFTGWPRPQQIPGTGMGTPYRYHATLFLGHHLSVASVFIFPFFAALDGLKAQWNLRIKNKFSFEFWIFLGMTLLGGITLFLTYSRTLAAALPLGILIWIFLKLPRRMAWVLGCLLLIALGAATQLPTVQSRIHDPNFNYGILTREELWLANFEFVKERPLLGVGWKHNQELSGIYLLSKSKEGAGDSVFSGHAHNNLIDMLGGTGIIGALFWLAWSGLVVVLALKSRSHLGSFGAGLFCAWVVFQINGLTQVNFWDAKVTHQLMWMVTWSLMWVP